ncbi:DUF2922 domain-containing protein [Romboutsia sp.]|uniref:DUF2922 domain-containing protein n=1 Tax=Romboutsia sp. TaxID=1965302 RepID=UPI002CDA0878|nr:DUF2922 domain-containing protein [Romboutsia sp.]HSQ87408.1 DUF2922 domain-containing protein [Romboutsia sp.]
MEIKTKLLMTFKTSSDKKVSISIDNPRPDVTESEILAVMNLIIANDIFAPEGSALTELVEAKIVQTDTTEFDLAV